MSIKINDTFSIERDSSCWILSITKPGFSNKKQEPIMTTTEIYPATLLQCCNRIIDMTAGEAKDIEEIKKLIVDTKIEIINKIGGMDLNGHLGGSEELERKDARGKGKSKGDKDNNRNEDEGTKGKVQVEKPKRSGKVDSERIKRTRKNGK